MKKFIPKNKTEDWAPKCSFINISMEEVEEYRDLWLKHWNNDPSPIPFINFLENHLSLDKINKFIDDFLNADYPKGLNFDFFINVKYYKYLRELMIEGKYRGFFMIFVKDMPENFMWITESEKPI